jgi:cyclin-dependent kinase
MGTPDDKLWPEALAMRDFKPTFPKWHPQDLSQVCPNLNPNGIDLLNKLLSLDPKARPTCREALEHPYFI